MGLNRSEKNIVQKAYKNNNDVQAVCNNRIKPLKFDELPALIRPSLTALYASRGILYAMLTSKTAYQKIKDKCGSLKAHFEHFRVANQYSICPFCGMENLITEYEDSKNEYDHYISKGDYPFCSINFKNLVPICDYCNKSGNKGQKDIAYIPNSNPAKQEKIYYPYTSNIANHKIKLEINSSTTDLKDPATWNLSVACSPASNNNRMERWKEIFNIESRYKGKIAKDSYTWKERIRQKYYLRCKKNGGSFQDFKIDMLDDFADYNNWNNGILMNSVHEFILNDPNCESYLSGNLVI